MKRFNFNQHLVLMAFTVVVFTIAALPSATSVCCHSYHPGICADCSKPTSRFLGFFKHCPAIEGGCDRFGCNCEGGCRQPPVGTKACAPTDHLFAPRLIKSERHCWLMGEDEICKGREFRRSEKYDVDV